MNLALLADGLLALAYGVVALARREWLWALIRPGIRWEGEASERTETWEIRMVAAGIIALVVGFVLIVVSLAVAR